MGEKRNACRDLEGKPKGKRLLERPRHRPEDNIKINRIELVCGDTYWINLGQDKDQWRAFVARY
jgi:hypothetical protein